MDVRHSLGFFQEIWSKPQNLFYTSEGSRVTIHSVTSVCAVMTMIVSQNLKFVDSTKAQKSKYLELEYQF